MATTLENSNSGSVNQQMSWNYKLYREGKLPTMYRQQLWMICIINELVTTTSTAATLLNVSHCTHVCIDLAPGSTIVKTVYANMSHNVHTASICG